jgi:DNA-directed RNA polymerase specialized sigma24 family protein
MNFENALQRLIEFSEKKDSVDFDVFFNDTKDLVYRVAFHYMRCDSEAEDILQSVFLKIFTYAQEKPKSISEIKNLKGWLIQIAVNSSKMSIRTKIRQREKNMKKKYLKPIHFQMKNRNYIYRSLNIFLNCLKNIVYLFVYIMLRI